jgi:hypothetical protein
VARTTDGGQETTMPGDHVILPIDADTLRTTFPHWAIIEAEGWWFALRRGNYQEIYAGPRSLVRHTLRASTEAELAERLALLDYLDSLSEAELTQVYHRAGPVPATTEAAPDGMSRLPFGRQGTGSRTEVTQDSWAPGRDRPAS